MTVKPITSQAAIMIISVTLTYDDMFPTLSTGARQGINNIGLMYSYFAMKNKHIIYDLFVYKIALSIYYISRVWMYVRW